MCVICRSGQMAGRGSVLGYKLESTLRVVGYFKGLVRIVKSQAAPAFDVSRLLIPVPYIVRVYVTTGSGVQPQDCDPYLKFKLGDFKIDDVKNHQTNTSQPEFFRCVG